LAVIFDKDLFLEIILILWEKRGKLHWRPIFLWRTHYIFGNVLFWTFGQIYRALQTAFLSYSYGPKYWSTSGYPTDSNFMNYL